MCCHLFYHDVTAEFRIIYVSVELADHPSPSRSSNRPYANIVHHTLNIRIKVDHLKNIRQQQLAAQTECRIVKVTVELFCQV